MASTFSTNLAIELIGTGDQAGTWGVTTNTNLGTLIEQAISGYVTQAVSTGADTTITIPNGATGVARNMYIELTGTGGTNTNLIVPSNKKLYFIFNNTSSGQVTVKVSGQTGVSVPNGKKVVLVCNGTDIVNGLNYIADFGTNSFTVTNLTASSGTITNLIATTASVSDASATVLRASSATLTHLSATSASITNLALTSLTISSLSITNVSVASATVSSNLTLSGGTANGVLYLNGSKVATSGSALTFDGTNFGVGTASPTYKLDVNGVGRNQSRFIVGPAVDSSDRMFYVSGNTSTSGASQFGAVINPTLPNTVTSSAYGIYTGLTIASGATVTNGYGLYLEGMSAGGSTVTNKWGLYVADTNNSYIGGNLGIGTASPGAKLHVVSSGSEVSRFATTGADMYLRFVNNFDTNGYIGYQNAALTFWTANTLRATLDSSGNLGLGSTPSAYNASFKAFELINGWAAISSNDGTGVGNVTCNAYATSTTAWAYKSASSYRATRYSFGIDGVHAWYNSGTGTAGNPISFTQAMTLDASGNLAVGTTTVDEILRLNGSSNATARIRLQNQGTTLGWFGSYLGITALGNGNDLFVANATNNALIFGTNGTERARITAAGFVGIGTDSPVRKLSVLDGSNTLDYQLQLGNTSTNCYDIGREVSSGLLKFYGNQSGYTGYIFSGVNGEHARITSGGDLLVGTTTTSTTSGTGFKVFANLGITGHFDASVVSAANSSSYSCWDLYSTAAGAYRFYVGTDGTVNATNTTISAISDQRLKENIRDLDVGLDAVMALKPRKFDWKEGKGQDKKDVRGFIAQEFEQVFPDLVDEWKDPAPEGEEPYKSVRQDLIPVLVKAIQELKAELDAAKVKIAALEAK